MFRITLQLNCFRADRKTKMTAMVALAETCSTVPLQLLNGIRRNLIRSKILISPYQVCGFAGRMETKTAMRAYDGPKNFFSANAEPNSMKLYRKQQPNALSLVPVLQLLEIQDGGPGL